MARAIKLDPQLAEAVDEAREALLPLVPEGSLGEHLSVLADADRLVTHRFASTVTGYRGWEWYVTLGRASRSKVVTVCESGLLPGPDALLAPDWVPWADRMSAAELAQASGEGSAEGQAEGDEAASQDSAEAAAGTEATEPAAAEGGTDVDDDTRPEPTEGTAPVDDEDAAAAAEDFDADEAEEADDDEPGARRAPRRRRRRRR